MSAGPDVPALRPGPRVLALVGPTASGKTALSLEVARRLGGEIVSMDSRQVYRGMDIGTAKATAGEQAVAPHWGLDLVDPDQRYSAGRFARDARGWIREIRSRGHLPLLVGGTGFFLRAVLDPIFAEPPLDPRRRERLRGWLSDLDREGMARWVAALDPPRASLAVEGGRQRMSRTLEVALLTGRPLSWWHRTAPPDGEGIPGRVVRIEVPREELDRRILLRAHRMVETGLVDEVRRLLDEGFAPDAPGMTGTGYREVVKYLRGASTLEELVEEIAAHTRQYARRQLTWFRNQLPPDTVSVDGTLPLEAQAEAVVMAWTRSGSVPGSRTGNEERR